MKYQQNIYQYPKTVPDLSPKEEIAWVEASKPHNPYDPSAQYYEPLIMIDKNSTHDPSFPSMMYRLGKYVDKSKAEEITAREYMAHQLYSHCFNEVKAIDEQAMMLCYQEKVAVFRQLIDVVKGVI